MGDFLSSQALAAFLADSKAVIAVCNLAALLGAIYGVCKLVAAIWRFIAEAWRTDVRKAIRIRRRRVAREVKMCSSDLHIYITAIVQRGMLIAISAVGSLVMVVQPILPANQRGAHKATLDFMYDPALVSGVSTTASMLLLGLFFVHTIILSRLTRFVARRRIRGLRRQRRRMATRVRHP